METSVGKVTVWIDSNVIVEIYSQGDLHRDAPQGQDAIERRRLLSQGSLWLTMALDEEGTVTVTFKHESKGTIEKLARLGTPAGDSVLGALHIVHPHVFPRWASTATNLGAELPEGREGNNLRDALMVKLCAEHGLAFVTRDQNGKRGEPSATKRAQDAGVPVSTPEAYAAKVLPFEVARDRFMERLATGVRKYVEELGVDPRGPMMAREMVLMQEVHRRIWLPAGAPLPPFEG